MKKKLSILFAITFFLFSNVDMYAQENNFRISVVSDKDPLGYAYVFINNKVFGAADSLGVVLIPFSQLHIGDTISVNYLGMANDFLIFDRKFYSNPEYKFTLKSNLELTEVVVVGDVIKFFKKNVEPKYTLLTNQKFIMNFDIKRYLNDKETFNATGNITIAFPSNMGKYRCLDITTTVDTSLIVRTVAEALSRAINSSAMTKYFSSWKEHITLKYMGVDGDNWIFTWSFFETADRKRIGQILIRANKQTKKIVNIEDFWIFQYNGHGIRTSGKYDLSVDKKQQYQVLKNIKYETQVDSSGYKTIISLSDIDVRPYKWKVK